MYTLLCKWLYFYSAAQAERLNTWVFPDGRKYTEKVLVFPWPNVEEQEKQKRPNATMVGWDYQPLLCTGPYKGQFDK